MAKIRVHELAKELAMESKDVVKRLADAGLDVKGPMSAIESSKVDFLRQEKGIKTSGNFVPKVTRIPRASVEAAKEEEAVSTAAKDKGDEPKPAAIGDKVSSGPPQEAKPNKPAEKSKDADVIKKEEPAAAASVTVKTEEKATIVPAESTAPMAETKPQSTPIETSKTVSSAPASQEQENYQSSRPQGGYQGNRPQGDRPQGGYQGNRPQGDRPQGGYQGNRPQGDRPQGGYQGNRPQGDRPQGGYQGNRPQGDRPQGGYQGNRPQGDRPQGGYQGNRPQGDRPQGGYQGNRPQGDRPQGGYQGNRPQGDRPQGGYQGNRPQGDRPQGGYQGNRPQGGYQGNRPQGGYQGNRPQGDRPQGGYQGNRPQGDRPQGGYQGNRPQGDRPQGSYQGNRPQGGYQGNRPQGGYQGNRPQGDRPQGGGRSFGAKPEAGAITPSPLEKPTSRRNDGKKKDFESWSQKGTQRIEEREINNKNRFIKGKNKGRRKEEARQIMPPVTPKKVIIGETVVLSELAKNMGKTAAELIKRLFEMGTLATINQELDSDTAILLAEEYHVPVEVRHDKSVEIMEDEVDDDTELQERPPVVTVMGHVDHGKTSLLDAIRKTNVISTEAGGITQHIGAYQVEVNNHKITFLDTPGHAAFTAMRARGAQMTDIAILVVAADDGVMPQTIEAINHSKAAGVPIIVAINKIDRPNANPDKVKQELTEYGLVSEEWGGDTIMVPLSAKKGEGIQTLLEMILLVSEVAEFKANPKRQARGVVVEAELDKGRGPVATLLVQKGTLRVGDNILAGSVFGKIRAMLDDKGRKVKSAAPSTPVVVLGFSEVPPPGEVFMVVKDEKDARYVAQLQAQKQREAEMNKTSRVSLDDLFAQISQGEVKDLNLILKADVQGSVEAVRQSLQNLSTDEVHIRIIHSGVGAINESDVMLATASNAIIIGFNVRPDAQTRKAAEKAGVDMRMYRVIYDAIDDMKKAISGLLAPEFKENLLGHAEVRSIFRVPKAGMVAGCYVQDGKISRGAQVRIVRDGILIFEGSISSLRRFKDDVKEVVSGYECGISVEDYNDIREGDTIEAFVMEEIKREV